MYCFTAEEAIAPTKNGMRLKCAEKKESSHFFGSLSSLLFFAEF